MFASTGIKRPKVTVLVVGECPHLFIFPRSPLGRVGCQCYFASSHREVSKLLSRTKIDIVLSLDTYQSLSKMTRLLTGLRVSMFHMLPVEEGCWWLPVVRNGEECLGDPAMSPHEFTYVLAEVVRDIEENTRLSAPRNVDTFKPQLVFSNPLAAS